MTELETRMGACVGHLNDVLRVTGLLRGASFPEDVKEMRFKCRQFEFMAQEMQVRLLDCVC